jgi:hypothetical protein
MRCAIDGTRKEYVLYSVKKGKDKIAALFLDPASERDRATLRLGENMWLYIPSVGKPLRITSLQSVIGGIFNNADILALEFSVEYAVEKAQEDAAAYTLSLKARTGDVAYDRRTETSNSASVRCAGARATPGALWRSSSAPRTRPTPSWPARAS